MAKADLPKVGFVGVGNQGGPIAERIAGAGFPLTVWARRPDVLLPFTALGATAASDITDLGACDIIGIRVLDDAAVTSVFDALLPALRPDTTVMILATIHPDLCVALASRAAEAGVAMIDAPVSGGASVARAGKLSVMVGGPAEAVERCRPVIESFAALIVHLGDVGAGQLAKLVNNALLTAHLALANDALKAGATLGLDRAALATLLGASSGRSYGVEIMGNLPSPAAFGTGAALLRKDVGLLEATARAKGADAGHIITTAGRFLAEVDREAGFEEK